MDAFNGSDGFFFFSKNEVRNDADNAGRCAEWKQEGGGGGRIEGGRRKGNEASACLHIAYTSNYDATGKTDRG